MLFLLIAIFSDCDLIVYFLLLLLVNLAGQPKSIRQTFLKERVLAADQLKAQHRNRPRRERFKNYRLHLHADMGRQTMMCQHSFRNLLGIFKYQWKTIRSSATSSLPGPITHGNSGKRNRFQGSNRKDVEDDVVQFLMDVADERGESYATRFIREHTSLGLRKDEEDLIELPSCLSMRGLFKQFCFERGHVVDATSKGSFGKVDEFTPRPNDELLWPEGSEMLPVLPWSTFFQIWKEKLPKLRIRNQCEDTCPECYILRNRFRYKSERSNRQQQESDSDASNSSSSNESDFSDEDLIAKANLHVEQAKSQRLYINELKAVAEEESRNEHTARRFVFCLFYFLFYAIN